VVVRRLARAVLLLGVAACATAPEDDGPEILPSAALPEVSPSEPVEPVEVGPEVYEVPAWAPVSPTTGKAEQPAMIAKDPPAKPKEGRRGPRGEGEGRGRERPDRAEMLRRFDTDGDGELSEEERAAARASRGGGRGGPPR
jgi:hypothetical protein